jgi:two-component system chemotaxis response regulator CheB
MTSSGDAAPPLSPVSRDIVVIGASAGGVEALQTMVAGLPADLPATVFVVLHVAPRSRSFLPGILSAAGPLPACHATDGMEIQQGRIYVAPPDHHMLIERGHIHLNLGPKENHQRPCINASFRSAAAAYGDRVIGVVLTGQLDDGTAGLWEIQRRGGLAVVQNPEEAAFPSMPLNAVREIEVDYIVRVAELGNLLSGLTRKVQENVIEAERREMRSELTDITCPDCRGTIWEIRNGSFVEYRCRIGHAYSPRSMLAEHFAAQEKVIWQSIVALEEGSDLSTRLADKLGPDLRERLLNEAHLAKQHAAKLRQLLSQRATFSLDQD